MKRFVISIGRQQGCGGKEVASKLAQRLGINVYDKTLLEVAAHESGLDTTVFENADERESNSFIGNLFSIHGSISSYIPGNSCMEGDKLFEIQSETIRLIAERENCIIVGRCGEYVLRDHQAMTSIFITADHKDRIKRIMESEGIGEEKAEAFIEKGDRRRKQYHDYYATTHWGEAHSYDICVNTSRLGIEGTVELLYTFIRNRFGL